MKARLEKLKKELDIAPLQDLEFNRGAIYMIDHVLKILAIEEISKEPLVNDCDNMCGCTNK